MNNQPLHDLTFVSYNNRQSKSSSKDLKINFVPFKKTSYSPDHKFGGVKELNGVDDFFGGDNVMGNGVFSGEVAERKSISTVLIPGRHVVIPRNTNYMPCVSPTVADDTNRLNGYSESECPETARSVVYSQIDPHTPIRRSDCPTRAVSVLQPEPFKVVNTQSIPVALKSAQSTSFNTSELSRSRRGLGKFEDQAPACSDSVSQNVSRLPVSVSEDALRGAPVRIGAPPVTATLQSNEGWFERVSVNVQPPSQPPSQQPSGVSQVDACSVSTFAPSKSSLDTTSSPAPLLQAMLVPNFMPPQLNLVPPPAVAAASTPIMQHPYGRMQLPPPPANACAVTGRSNRSDGAAHMVPATSFFSPMPRLAEQVTDGDSESVSNASKSSKSSQPVMAVSSPFAAISPQFAVPCAPSKPTSNNLLNPAISGVSSVPASYVSGFQNGPLMQHATANSPNHASNMQDRMISFQLTPLAHAVSSSSSYSSTRPDYVPPVDLSSLRQQQLPAPVTPSAPRLSAAPSFVLSESSYAPSFKDHALSDRVFEEELIDQQRQKNPPPSHPPSLRPLQPVGQTVTGGVVKPRTPRAGGSPMPTGVRHKITSLEVERTQLLAQLSQAEKKVSKTEQDLSLMRMQLMEERRKRFASAASLADAQGRFRVFCRVRASAEGRRSSLLKVHDDWTLTLDDGLSTQSRRVGGAPGGGVTLRSSTGAKLAVQSGKPAEGGKKFVFDRVFDPSCNQLQVFREVEGVVDSVIAGGHGTLFGYGPSGGGKSYSLLKVPAACNGFSVHDSQARRDMGVIGRAIEKIFFAYNEGVSATQAEMLPSVRLLISAVEVYGESVFDLLDTNACANTRIGKPGANLSADAGKPVRFVNGEAIVEGLLEAACVSQEEAFAALQEVFAARTTASTAYNSVSSRSHLIVSIRVQSVPASQRDLDDPVIISEGSLTVVDLAGAERALPDPKESQHSAETFVAPSSFSAAQTKTAEKSAVEAKMINKQLACLGEVIIALRKKSAETGGDTVTHAVHGVVPFRNSKLTQLLARPLSQQGSKLVFLVCVDSDAVALDHQSTDFESTVATSPFVVSHALGYASQMRQVKASNSSVQRVQEQAQEIQRLRKIISEMSTQQSR